MFHDFGFSAKETHAKLVKTYGEDVISYDTCKVWFAKFKKGDFTLEDAPRAGRPRELDLDVLRSTVEEDPYLTTRELGARLGFAFKTIANGLEKLGKTSKLGRWVPHELSDYDLSRRVVTCTSLLTLQKKRHFLNSLITGDEKWVLYDNPVRKRQWVNKGEQPEPVPKADLHPKKVLLSCWWSRKGMEHWELLEKGQTINATMYVEQLQKLKAHIDRTRGKNAEVYFHHDNARPHTAKATQAELEKYDWVVIPQAPYSPDLAPSDYWLFSHLQRSLNGKKFETKDEVEKAINEFFKSQPPSFWEEGIDKLPERWRRVVDGDGAYL
ncbi:hypothetical protein V3C99_011401 [Haemonchus contortus]|uniref:HTH_48 domain-containing protein n=1 Tax=Haemonchus contortus TaxID=6289 RepID=A0A7I4Y6S9_HAECO|nr:Transposase domain containing protein [Haemonchus contortus]